VLFFSYSCNKDYQENEISEVINVTLNQFPKEKLRYSIEFAPRIEHNISDEVFFENLLKFSGDKIDDSITLTKDNINFMLMNKKKLIQESKKISNYIICNDKCVETDPYFKGEKEFFNGFDSFVRITYPYISINSDFAIIGYSFHSEFKREKNGRF